MQKDEVERERFRERVEHYPAEYFVFVDEMFTNNRTRRRRRGRARRGKAAYMPEFFSSKQKNMNTLIAACNINGMVKDACHVSDHNNSREDFVEYVRKKLIPRLGPFPGIVVSYADSIV